MLYQEADHGPVTPGTRFGEAPYTSGPAFGPAMGRVGYDHRMEVALNGREVDPGVKGVRRAGGSHSRKRTTIVVCVTIRLTRKGGFEPGNMRLQHYDVSQPSRVLHTSFQRL